MGGCAGVSSSRHLANIKGDGGGGQRKNKELGSNLTGPRERRWGGGGPGGGKIRELFLEASHSGW